MNWIKPLERRVLGLDTSVKVLKSFSLIIGFGFLLIGIVLMRNNGLSLMANILIAVGILGALIGLIYPPALKYPYYSWMVLGMMIGWCVSRALLTLLFFVVMTPIGLLARLLGKQFLLVTSQKKTETFWQPKKPRSPKQYEKMY